MAKPLKVRKISSQDRPEEAAVRILRTRLMEFYSHWPDPETLATPQIVHNTRISGKRLRYSAESLRTLYRDRLALLLELLRKEQDLMGKFQDAIFQRTAIEAELARRVRRRASEAEQEALGRLIAGYREKEESIFEEVALVWRGVCSKKFRASLKSMISKVEKARPTPANENSPLI
jgi:CHAD domain-containing protein